MRVLYIVDEAKQLTLSPHELKDIYFKPCYGFMAKDNTIKCKVAQNYGKNYDKILKTIEMLKT